MAAYNPTAGDPPYRPDLRLGGNIDGWVLAENPVDAIEQRRFHDVPVLLGTTTTEYASLVGLMLAQFGPAATPEQYQAQIQHWFGVYGQDVVDAVLARYPSDAFGTPMSTLIRILTDAFFTAPQRRLARALWVRKPTIRPTAATTMRRVAPGFGDTCSRMVLRTRRSILEPGMESICPSSSATST